MDSAFEKIGLKNVDEVDINPATEEKQDDIIAALGGGSSPYIVYLVVKSTDADVFYLGKAVGGSATSSAVWQIKEITYDGIGGQVILLADGNDNFDNEWDDRESLSYS